MTVLYFTATGNNLYLAKRIGGNLVSIPQAVKHGIYEFEDDKIGIVFPVYGWAVPPYVRDFLSKVRMKSKYVFAVMSYGMTAGGVASHLEQLASQHHIQFSYINTIKMVDNYIPGFDMKKQIAGEPQKQVEEHLNMIRKDIADSKQWLRKTSLPTRLMTRILLRSDGFKIGVGVAGKFSIEDTCTHCGICAKVCPVDNVKVSGAKPEFGAKCTSCLACTQNCPQNAIRIAGEKSKVRYRNQHIAVSEIIDANE